MLPEEEIFKVRVPPRCVGYLEMWVVKNLCDLCNIGDTVTRWLLLRDSSTSWEVMTMSHPLTSPRERNSIHHQKRMLRVACMFY